MSRFVDAVPDRARTAIYIAAFLVAVEIVASLLAAGLLTALFLLDPGLLDAFVADPVGFALPIMVGFQSMILEYEAIMYVVEPYTLMPYALVVPLVTTTLYVVSGWGLWRVLGRVGIDSGRDVDQWIEDRHA